MAAQKLHRLPGQTSSRAILLMLAAVFLFAIMNATAKYLTQFYPVMEVVWARFVFYLLFALLLSGRRGIWTVFHTRRPVLQILRGGLMIVATIFFIGALSFMQLAEVEAISFAAPLFVTALSVPLLKERVGIRRWAAVVVGFVGVLVIIRPGLGVVHWAAFFPLITAACYALLQILTRILSRTDSSVSTLVYSGAVGSVIMSLVVPFFWVPPTAWGWGLMVLTGALGTGGHFLLIKAIEAAPASMLQPFSYTQLIWASVIGFVVFAELPDLWTFVGAGIIMASGLYILYRERVRSTRAEG
jgi:drug/metabolite transporter (DMT)-like permease